jgi:hypothetical protein
MGIYLPSDLSLYDLRTRENQTSTSPIYVSLAMRGRKYVYGQASHYDKALNTTFLHYKEMLSEDEQYANI